MGGREEKREGREGYERAMEKGKEWESERERERERKIERAEKELEENCTMTTGANPFSFLSIFCLFLFFSLFLICPIGKYRSFSPA